MTVFHCPSRAGGQRRALAMAVNPSGMASHLGEPGEVEPPLTCQALGQRSPATELWGRRDSRVHRLSPHPSHTVTEGSGDSGATQMLVLT